MGYIKFFRVVLRVSELLPTFPGFAMLRTKEAEIFG